MGLYWRRGLEAKLWKVIRYPTWLMSQGALIDFCVTELGCTWLDERFQQPSSQWKPIWLHLSPPEHRRMIIQEIGYDRICQECKTKVVDTWQNHTLLWFPIRGGKQYLLKTVCETTGTNQYVEVPALTSVRAAFDWVNEQTSEE